LWFIEGDWWKVPFDDHRRRSFKMATMSTILDLVSVHYLMNASVNWSDFLAHLVELLQSRCVRRLS
jgi:hypothetical protein